MISAVAFANALYSASVLDLDTVACFLAFQETRFDSKNIAKPHVDRLSSRLPTQSASLKPLTMRDVVLSILSPGFVVCFTYLKILLTAAQ
jgi:hypothetical protein